MSTAKKSTINYIRFKHRKCGCGRVTPECVYCVFIQNTKGHFACDYKEVDDIDKIVTLTLEFKIVEKFFQIIYQNQCILDFIKFSNDNEVNNVLFNNVLNKFQQCQMHVFIEQNVKSIHPKIPPQDYVNIRQKQGDDKYTLKDALDERKQTEKITQSIAQNLGLKIKEVPARRPDQKHHNNPMRRDLRYCECISVVVHKRNNKFCTFKFKFKEDSINKRLS